MIVNGSVKFFNEERGYGFVLPDQPLGDAFFHIASLRKMGIPRVIPGQRAVFEISIAPGRGLRVERFFLIHSGAPEQCALEAELLSSLTQVRGEIAMPLVPASESLTPEALDQANVADQAGVSDQAGASDQAKASAEGNSALCAA